VIARIVAALLAMFLAAAPAVAQQAVDLELVLAIDSSNSVSASEWGLQMKGYATAFRDPRVQTAIASGPAGRIGVAAVIWADDAGPKHDGPWFVLATPADCEGFAAYMDALGRGIFGETGIGAGIAVAIHAMRKNGLTSPRQVIDVSGDGRERPTKGVMVPITVANELAWENGVTVNGLAILNEDPDLALWYAANVIAGPHAFVMTADDYHDFVEAIVRKLIREIEHKERLSLR
jgi:hypothetical protein